MTPSALCLLPRKGRWQMARRFGRMGSLLARQRRGSSRSRTTERPNQGTPRPLPRRQKNRKKNKIKRIMQTDGLRNDDGS